MLHNLRILALVLIWTARSAHSQILRHTDSPLYSYDNAIINLQFAQNIDLVENYIHAITEHALLIHNHSIFEEVLSSKDNNSLRSANCVRDMLNIMRKGGISTFQWLDSMGHIPPGLTGGAATWPGSFELCLSISENIFPAYSNFSTKYCSILLALKQLKNLPMNLHVGIRSGFCLPQSCDPGSIFYLINKTIYNFGFEVDDDASFCHSSPGSLPRDGWFWFAIMVVLLSALLMLCGSAIDVLLYFTWYYSLHKRMGALLQQRAESDAQDAPLLDPTVADSMESCIGIDRTIINETRKDATCFWDYRSDILTGKHCVVQGLCAFSVPYNSYKLFCSPRPNITNEDGSQSPHPLIFLDGIRVLTMIWIIFGHTILLSFFTTNNLLLYVQKNFRRWTYQVIIGGTLSVDTFFMLSGLLSVYTAYPRFTYIKGVWKQLKFWMFFVFHRFIRMTPAYLLVLILYTGLFIHLTDGPFYPQRPQLTDIMFCQKHGWLTYLNNFIFSTQMCMPWSWYLANDFQFSVVLAPLYISLSNWNEIIGQIFAFLLVLSSTLTTFGIAYHEDYLPGALSNTGDGFDTIYVKPYTRWGTYAVGLALGWILIKGYKTSVSWSNVKKQVFVWISLAVSSVLCLSSVYGLYSLISGKVNLWPTGTSAFFTAAHRPAFTLGVAIVVYLCANNYTPPIKSLLGLKVFSPFARLTYGAYLIHPIVLMFFALGSQSVILMDNLYLIIEFIAAYVTSYCLAIVINMATEAPLLNLEKLVRFR